MAMSSAKKAGAIRANSTAVAPLRENRKRDGCAMYLFKRFDKPGYVIRWPCKIRDFALSPRHIGVSLIRTRLPVGSIREIRHPRNGALACGAFHCHDDILIVRVAAVLDFDGLASRVVASALGFNAAPRRREAVAPHVEVRPLKSGLRLVAILGAVIDA